MDDIVEQRGHSGDGDCTEEDIDNEVLEKLKFGLLSPHLPDLQKCKSQLDEVIRSQSELLESVDGENHKFEECQNIVNLDEMVRLTKDYHNKLVNLRKEMNSLHDRAGKLKKRAVRLQQAKHKEVLEREQRRERELEEERRITARVAAQPTQPRPHSPTGPTSPTDPTVPTGSTAPTTHTTPTASTTPTAPTTSAAPL